MPAAAAVSLLLHALVAAVLIWRPMPKPDQEDFAAPGPVSMVFEGGKPDGPTTSDPKETLVPSFAPPADVGGPQGGATPPAAPLMAPEAPPVAPRQPATPPAAQPETPTPVAPPRAEDTTAPKPEAPPPPPPQPDTPPPEPPPPDARPPVPDTPPPPPPAPAEETVPVPPPNPPKPVPTPPKQAQVTPPRPPDKTPPKPEQPARPAEPPPVKQAAPAEKSWPPAQPTKPSEFPAPMEFALQPPVPKPGANAAGKPMLSLGLTKKGSDDSSPFSIETDAEVGPDWRNALSAWVHDHAYYPSQAAMMHQQGSVRVLITTTPEGKVLSVDMERSSGSQWLDLALEGLFRGAKLPPMPKSAGTEPVPFHFTMHYILIP